MQGRVEEGRVERGEPEQSLPMFYSKGEIIAGLWFHLILLLLTGSFRKGIGVCMLPCYQFKEHGTYSRRKSSMYRMLSSGESYANHAHILLLQV